MLTYDGQKPRKWTNFSYFSSFVKVSFSETIALTSADIKSILWDFMLVYLVFERGDLSLKPYYGGGKLFWRKPLGNKCTCILQSLKDVVKCGKHVINQILPCKLQHIKYDPFITFCDKLSL